MPLSIEQVTQVWSAITAEVLCLRGGQSFVTKAFAGCMDVWRTRLGSLRRGREIVIEDAGHNLHQDCPDQVAELVERFVLSGLSGEPDTA